MSLYLYLMHYLEELKESWKEGHPQYRDDLISPTPKLIDNLNKEGEPNWFSWSEEYDTNH